MSSNKFDKLFNPKQESMHLSYIYFSYYDKVKDDEKNELFDAFIRASDIAEKRELKEAELGILR